MLQINRKYTATNILLGKDTFVVTVFPNVDYVFIAALVVILDEIHRERLTDNHSNRKLIEFDNHNIRSFITNVVIIM